MALKSLFLRSLTGATAPLEIVQTGGPGDNQFLGTADNDTLSGAGGNDTLFGRDGSDSLVGGKGDDALVGGDEPVDIEDFAADTLLGGSGNDILVGQNADLLDGGGGLDYAVVLLSGSEGVDIDLAASARGEAQALSEGGVLVGVEQLNIVAGSGDDRIAGYNYDDSLFGGEGSDTLRGGGGNDELIARASVGDGGVVDILDGGAGSDTMFGALGDSFFGGAGDTDVAYVTGVSAVALRLSLKASAEGVGQRLWGEGVLKDVETINLHASVGDDRITGYINWDTISAGAGRDTVDGGAGNDRILGEEGRDLLIGGAGNDLMYGDAEGSFPDYSAADTLHGGAGDDSLRGGLGPDVLTGDRGDDNLLGADGADYLDGGDGDDYITHTGFAENNGLNTIIGGAGLDVLFASSGDDLFIYNALSDSTAKRPDQIWNFENGDLVDLTAIDADTTQDGDQAFTRVDAFSGTAGELAVFAGGGVTTRAEADVNGDGEADMTIVFYYGTTFEFAL